MKKPGTFVKTITLLAALVSVTVTSPIHAGTTRSIATLTVGNAPMVQLTPEQIETAVEEYFDAVGALDVPRYVNTFAPDGVLEDPVGTPPIQGTAALTSQEAGGVAWWAHIGGFAAGFVVAWLLKRAGYLNPPVESIRPNTERMMAYRYGRPPRSPY